LTEIYLCHACSYQEIEDGNGPDRYFDLYPLETVPLAPNVYTPTCVPSPG
jgi:hypothetical protein